MQPFVIFTNSKIGLCASTAYPKEIKTTWQVRPFESADYALLGWGEFTVTRQTVWIYPNNPDLNVDYEIGLMVTKPDLYAALVDCVESPNLSNHVYTYHPLAQLIVDSRATAHKLTRALETARKDKEELRETFNNRFVGELRSARMLSKNQRGEKHPKIDAIRAELGAAYTVECERLNDLMAELEQQITDHEIVTREQFYTLQRELGLA